MQAADGAGKLLELSRRSAAWCDKVPIQPASQPRRAVTWPIRHALQLLDSVMGCMEAGTATQVRTRASPAGAALPQGRPWPAPARRCCRPALQWKLIMSNRSCNGLVCHACLLHGCRFCLSGGRLAGGRPQRRLRNTTTARSYVAASSLRATSLKKLKPELKTFGSSTMKETVSQSGGRVRRNADGQAGYESRSDYRPSCRREKGTDCTKW